MNLGLNKVYTTDVKVRLKSIEIPRSSRGEGGIP